MDKAVKMGDWKQILFWIQQQHDRPHSFLSRFTALSWPYELAIHIRNLLYDTQVRSSYRFRVPTISIGNLSTGGTGKTPITLSLGQVLQSYTPLILSRGYKKSDKQAVGIVNSPAQGDEAFLMARALLSGNVVTGHNRIQAALATWHETCPGVVILEDGFQHRQIHRDLDIVLIDGTLGLGNGKLLPVGPLRESVNALKRADIVLVTKVSEIPPGLCLLLQQFPQLRQYAVPFSYSLSQSIQWENPIQLLSGIAKPEAFLKTVKALGLKELDHDHVFPDHHPYQSDDLRDVITFLETSTHHQLLTTEKDWVKLQGILQPSLLEQVTFVRVVPELNWPEILEQTVLHERFSI
jgi:tetraacyldisaccharide 4'-kinase